MGIRSESCQCVCVGVSIKTLYMQSKEIHYKNTNNTHPIRNQKPIFNYQIYNKNTQSMRYITRYVTHIEKETESIPLLEDW